MPEKGRKRGRGTFEIEQRIAKKLDVGGGEKESEDDIKVLDSSTKVDGAAMS